MKPFFVAIGKVLDSIHCFDYSNLAHRCLKWLWRNNEISSGVLIFLLSFGSIYFTFALDKQNDELAYWRESLDAGQTYLNNFIEKNDFVVLLAGLGLDSISIDRQAYIYALTLHGDKRSEAEITKEAEDNIKNVLDYQKIINADSEVKLAKAKLKNHLNKITEGESNRGHIFTWLYVINSIIPFVAFVSVICAFIRLRLENQSKYQNTDKPSIEG